MKVRYGGKNIYRTHVCLDNEPEEINLEQECKKEDEKITRSGLQADKLLKGGGKIQKKQRKLWRPEDKATSRKEKS